MPPLFPKLRRMKTPLALLATALLSVLPALAQTPATSKSATVDVVESNGNAALLDSWAGTYGSFEKTKATTRALGITVRNMSAAAGGFRIRFLHVD